MRHAACSLLIIATLLLGAAGAWALDAQFIAELQQSIEQRGLQWQAGPNPITELSPEQYRRIAGGLLLDDWSLAQVPIWRGDAKNTLPDQLDWRANPLNFTTGAKNQGRCGACGAFAGCSLLESLMEIYYDDPDLEPDMSEAHLFFCSGGQCDGGTTADTVLDYMVEYGTPDEQCFPYEAGDDGEDQPCSDHCSDWEQRAEAIIDYSWVSGNSQSIMLALNEGPLLVGMLTYEDFGAYTDGIYEHTTGEQTGAHGVLMVGYDEDEQYWICKNSWGAAWGEGGFFRIRWGQCEIERYVFKGEYAGGVPCSQNTAPELGPVRYYVGETQLEQPQINVGDALRIEVEFQDAQCNLAGGDIQIDLGEGQGFERYLRLPSDAGCSSNEYGPIIYEPEDLSVGEHSVHFRAVDRCDDRSEILDLSYSVSEPTPDQDDDDDDAQDAEEDDDAGCCS
ncbi:MAG: C1 family peptidase [Candidatus Alcyoniella australis]|nr:C1 family peptidase [Candidatus Alcyoniella australis]